MINPKLIDDTQRFLFATEEEMLKAHLDAAQRRRILRLRDLYAYWLNNPQKTDKEILIEEQRRYEVHERSAYEDIRILKICIGNLNQMTKDWYTWVMIQRCEEGFQMARDKGDPKAFAQVLAAFGKFTKLDKEDTALPDYSLIVPQQFEITSDPKEAGFKRVANLDKLVKKLEQRFRNEAESAEYETVEIKNQI